MVSVLEKDGEVLDVGRKTRTVPPALRRALEARDKGCRFPGCTNRLVDAHHVVHWADGGETKLGNLLQLCRRHHGLLHEGGFTVRGTPETGLTFLDAQGKPVLAVRPAVELPAWGGGPLRESARAGGVEIEPETNLPDWDGQTPDYAWAVDDLCALAGQA